VKILFLADSNSPHTIRWAEALSNLDYKVGLFSIHKPDVLLYSKLKNLSLFSINISRELQNRGESSKAKFLYLKSIKSLKRIIAEFKPDILHSHYASSYGLIGALSGFNPYIISAWGGDIFSFPNNSFLHKNILKFSLSRADKILSTSRIMRDELKKYTGKDVIVTPFGVDLVRFKPGPALNLFDPEDIVVGTIKTLEDRYGIEYLIKGFHILKQRFPEKPLKLLIVGGGTLKDSLEKLVANLGLKDCTLFTGFINNQFIQDYYNSLDIYVAMSKQESFGVAILEASACCKPVIVSNVGGLPEVVENEKTGFIIGSQNSLQLADALTKLILDSELRVKFGKCGREKVIHEYDWQLSVKKMISVYNSIIKDKSVY
jgi:L-malate glycosyltransferase